MNLIRILKDDVPLPLAIRTWATERHIQLISNNGLLGANSFTVYDLKFDTDEDAIEFKLRFGECIFTEEENKIIDSGTLGDRPTATGILIQLRLRAKRNGLRSAKADIYVSMRVRS